MSRRSGRTKSAALETSKTPDIENSPEEDEQGEVTRCICGNDEIASVNSTLQQLLFSEYSIKIDNGLFIQCEKCSVWQHGYCVGLFIDQDVPDKYWCEECKPSLHIFVTDHDDQSARTLYRPVNESREALIKYSSQDSVSSGEKSTVEEGSEKNEKPGKPEKATRSRARRSPATADSNSSSSASSSSSGAKIDPEIPNSNSRQTRKERRHGEDVFDEQLQRALRESVSSGTNDKKRAATDSEPTSSKRSHSEESENEVAESNQEDESETTAPKRESRAKTKPRGKQKTRAQPSRGSTPQPKNEQEKSVVSKEELLSRPSKPRFVNDKSTIYELRKRTGAILEWLGRSQMELEEERDVKTLQFKEANVEGTNLLLSVEENSKLMENLTEKILAWEQKYGKYAP